MEKVILKNLYRQKEKYADKDICIEGWVRTIRDSKTFGFLVVNDGTYFEPLQVVFHDAMSNFSDICHLKVLSLKMYR